MLVMPLTSRRPVLPTMPSSISGLFITFRTGETLWLRLKPGGFLFAEEPAGGVLNHSVMHRLFAQPVEDRFEAADFRDALTAADFVSLKEEHLWRTLFWFVATKPASAQPDAPPNGGPATQGGNSGCTGEPPSVG